MTRRMEFEEALAAPGPGTPPRTRDPHLPAAWTPGVDFDEDRGVGTLVTPAQPSRPRTWDALIADAGLDPDEVETVGGVQVRGWDSPSGQRMRYYRLTLRRRGVGVNVDELLALARKARPRTPAQKREDGRGAFVVLLGDLQLGKSDGDGPEGTWRRTFDDLDLAVARYRQLRRRDALPHVHIGFLGDCIEGRVSQGGRNIWRTPLTLTEQLRLTRRVMLETVRLFAPLADTVSVVSVPGNHDETGRDQATRGDDSYAVDALDQVGFALAENPDAYGHVRLHTPPRDRLTVALDVAGTGIAHAHGHQWQTGREHQWWQAQAFYEQAVGDAQLLVAGHRHHFSSWTRGPRSFIQVPALESESAWWLAKTGETGAPGIVSLVVRDGGWERITFHNTKGAAA